VASIPAVTGGCFHQTTSDKPSVLYLLISKQQKHKLRNQLVRKVEHLATEKPDIFLTSGGNNNKCNHTSFHLEMHLFNFFLVQLGGCYGKSQFNSSPQP